MTRRRFKAPTRGLRYSVTWTSVAGPKAPSAQPPSSPPDSTYRHYKGTLVAWTVEGKDLEVGGVVECGSIECTSVVQGGEMEAEGVRDREVRVEE